MTDPTTANENSKTWGVGGDLTVNRLGFGAMRVTGQGIWGEPANHDEAVAVLRRAVELGVNFIDPADSYGPFVSERLIAEALHPYPEDLVIATKAGLLRDGPDQWRPDGRPQRIKACCEESLQRLDLEQIPLYQFHRPDPAIPFEDSLAAFIELKNEGKIRHIGLSNVDDAQISAALELTPIVSVQNRYNPTDRSSADVLDRCETERIAFLPYAPIGGNQGIEDSTLSRIAKAHGASPRVVILAWMLALSDCIIPIPGTGSVSHLEDNMKAADLELTASEVAALAGLAS
jgi:pyridoxine 4-dehydrogenase